MLKRFFLLLLFVLLTTVLLGQDQFDRRVGLAGFSNDGDSQTSTLGRLAEDTFRLTFFFLNGIEPVVLNDFSDLDPATSCREHQLDYIVYGSVEKASSGYVFQTRLYSDDVGKDVLVQEDSSGSSFAFFDFLDEQTNAVLASLLDSQPPMGSLAFYNMGAQDLEYQVFVNGRNAGESPEFISRVPAGNYPFEIRQTTGPEQINLLSGQVSVTESETTDIVFEPYRWGYLHVNLSGPGESVLLRIGDRTYRAEDGESLIVPSGIYNVEIYQLEDDFKAPLSPVEMEISDWERSEINIETLEFGRGFVFRNKGAMGEYKVLVDGREFNGSPFGVPLLEVGNHHVQVIQTFSDGSKTVVYDDRVKSKSRRDVSVAFRLEEDDIQISNWMVPVEGGYLEDSGALQYIPGFYLSKFETTRKLWGEIMNEQNTASQNNMPVVTNSWLEVVEFCNRLSEREGLEQCYDITGEDIACDFSKNGYRLPTKREWLFAVRRGLTYSTEVHRGNFSPLPGHYTMNGQGELIPVGQYPPDASGIFDLSGNSSEWVWDSEEEGTRLVAGGMYFLGDQTFFNSYSFPVDRVPKGGLSGNLPFVGFRVCRTNTDALPELEKSLE